MERKIFTCSGFKNTVQFRLEDGFICIAETPKKDELIVKENDLICIKCSNYPWMSQCSKMNIELTFIYNNNGKQKAKSIILNNLGENVTELLDFLKDRYRAICLIGPTEKERTAMFSSAHADVYQLHSLHILTPLGVIYGFLFLFVFVLYLMLVTSDQAVLTNPAKMNVAGLVIMIISLIPLGMMHLIKTKRFMVVRTDLQGITVRRFFGSKYYPWDRVIVETPNSEIYNVYIGLYCEASDHGEVAAARELINVRLSARGGKEVMLSMSVEEASRFYRELYYRNKISLDEAMQIRAFF